MQTLARFAVTRRYWVIAGWIVLFIGAQALASAAGGSAFKDVFTLPHTETQKVLDLLRTSGQGGQTGQTGSVVVHARTGTLTVATPPPGLVPALERLCGAGDHVAEVTSPWQSVTCPAGSTGQTPAPAPAPPSRPGNPALLSRDSTTALVNINWQGNQNDLGNFTGVHDALDKLATPQLQYEFTGTGFDNLDAQQKGLPPEFFGFIAALIILGLVFRTFGASVLPLLSAAAALGTGIGLISLLSHTMNVANFSTQLAELMVIGVGVDYALFIVTRHRRNLLRGMSVPESIILAVNTSGRAVLFAGLTVCIAILGLCALGVSFLYGVAIGTSIAVALTLAASLTLLPAVLSLLGLRVLPRRVRREVRAGTYVPSTNPTRWAGWASFVGRRKLLLGVVASAVIVVLAIPMFSIRLGHAAESVNPTSTTTRRGYDLISQHFGPGYNSVLELVISGPGATDQAYLSTVAHRLATVTDVNPTSIAPVPISSDLALVTFKSTSAPQDAATTSVVKELRRSVAPELERGTANQVYVFGQTAVFVDFAKVLSAKMPLFFTAIIGLSFLLLMVAFRSVVIPLTAAVMNLFAAGASFGIIVAIFQWGWLSGLLGIGGGGPIDAFLPVLFFAILFGLSMDYQVFLVSRMHEEWVHTKDNARAIRVGQAETGGIITAAAVIMIAVFGGFILAPDRTVKLIGIGLGGAIFLDAFILRTVLVPALMHALGRSNWYFPRWLDRAVPHVSVEPDDDSWDAQSGHRPDDERELAGV